MLLQTTKRNTDGTIVARVSLCPEWEQYLITVYHHGVQVSAHYVETRLQAVTAAEQATLQSVTIQHVSSKAMTEPLTLVPH